MPYKDPPQIAAAELSGWTHQQQNYFWHPGAQQAEHPHLHMTGSTISGIVTISNLSYTTGGAGGNFAIQFTRAGGYALISQEISYKRAYNIMIEDLNRALITV